MTNEQAKKMLKAKLECLKRGTSGIDCNDGYNCDECELLYAQGTAGEQKEALDMAINALEKEPSEEYRKGWHDAITTALKETHNYYTEDGVFSAIQEESLIGVGMSMQVPKAGWIPVKEKLPEKTDYYLIQYSREVCPDEMAVAFYSVEEAELDSNYTWEFKPIADCKEVIAWQPLPEPYKAESEDKE